MSDRVKIVFPNQVHFLHELKIRVTDLNYGGHMGNEKVLMYAQEARMAFFHSIQASEKNFFGTGIIQADAQIQYKAEGFFNDEIQVQIAVAEVATRSFNLYYRMENMTQQNTLAMAKTGMVCFDYQIRKPAPVPVEFLNALKNTNNI